VDTTAVAKSGYFVAKNSFLAKLELCADHSAKLGNGKEPGQMDK